MTELNAIQRLRVFEETPANFGLDQTAASLGSFIDVPFIEKSLSYTLNEDLIDSEIQQSKIDGVSTAVVGKRSCTLSFAMNMAPTGVPAVDTVTAVEGALGTLLGGTFGGRTLTTGMACTLTPTTTTTNTSVSPASANVDPGACVGFLTGAGGAYQMREVQSVGGATVNLKHALSSAPSASDDIHGAASYYLNQSATVPSSFQFAVEGLDEDDRWLLMGMQLDSISFDMTLNAFPRITFNFKGVAWLRGNVTGSVLTGVPLGLPSFVNDSPILTAGRFDIVDVGTEAIPADDLCIKSLDLSLNISYQEIPCASGVGQVKRWVRTRQSPAISGSFTTFFDAPTFFDDRSAVQKKYIFGQIGNTAGESILISIPTAQIMDVQRVDYDELAGQTVSFRGELDGDVTGTDSDIDMALSPFRIHLG